MELFAIILILGIVGAVISALEYVFFGKPCHICGRRTTHYCNTCRQPMCGQHTNSVTEEHSIREKDEEGHWETVTYEATVEYCTQCPGRRPKTSEGCSLPSFGCIVTVVLLGVGVYLGAGLLLPQPGVTPIRLADVPSTVQQAFVSASATQNMQASATSGTSARACVVDTNSLRVRKGPGTDYPEVGFLERNECVQLDGQSPDHGWGRIAESEQLPGGWLSLKYLDVQGGPEHLPVRANNP